MLQLKSTRDLGDLSENADFQAAKTENRINDAKISEIKKALATAEISAAKIKSNKPSLNTTVIVKSSNGKLKAISIVNDSEVSRSSESVGLSSATAKQLLKKTTGDVVKLLETGKPKAFKILCVTPC